MLALDVNAWILIVASVITLGFSAFLLNDALRRPVPMHLPLTVKADATSIDLNLNADEVLESPIVRRAIDPITSLPTYIIELHVPNRPERWRARFELEPQGGLLPPATMAALADLVEKSVSISEPRTRDLVTSVEARIRAAMRAQHPKLVRADATEV